MKKCPNCNITINTTNSVCPTCGTKLITKSIYPIIILIFIGPWIMFGLIFMLVGGVLHFREYNLSKEYVKTTGHLEEYYNCNEGTCSANYSYQVDGEIYYASPNLSSDSFSEKADVYYNPNNPRESMMFSGWKILFIAGLLIIIGFSIGGIIAKKKMDNFVKKINPLNINK